MGEHNNPINDPEMLEAASTKYKQMTKKQRVEHNLKVMSDAQFQAIYQLKQVRKKLKVNQTQMGALLGVCQNSIYLWETASIKIRHPRMLELALKYLMNTHCMRTPLPGLSKVITDIQKEEQEFYAEATGRNTDTVEPTKSRAKSKRNNRTK